MRGVVFSSRGTTRWNCRWAARSSKGRSPSSSMMGSVDLAESANLSASFPSACPFVERRCQLGCAHEQRGVARLNDCRTEPDGEVRLRRSTRPRESSSPAVDGIGGNGREASGLLGAVSAIDRPETCGCRMAGRGVAIAHAPSGRERGDALPHRHGRMSESPELYRDSDPNKPKTHESRVFSLGQSENKKGRCLAASPFRFHRSRELLLGAGQSVDH